MNKEEVRPSSKDETKPANSNIPKEEPKPVIKSVDMDEDMKQDAIHTGMFCVLYLEDYVFIKICSTYGNGKASH